MLKNKKLYWLRGAESEQETPNGDDFYRQLNGRGQKQAMRVRDYLACHDEVRPTFAFCSKAKRCRQTFEIIATALPDTHVIYHNFLYLASGYTVLELMSFLEDSVESVLVVGHSKALKELTFLLSIDGAELLNRCGYGTFVQLKIEPNVHWRDIHFKKAVVTDIFYP